MKLQVLIIAGKMTGASLTLHTGESVILGRDGQVSQLVFNDPSISRRHCTIQFGQEGEIMVTDHSVAGTYINRSQKLQNGNSAYILSGDTLTLGTTENTVQVAMIQEQAGMPNKRENMYEGAPNEQMYYENQNRGMGGEPHIPQINYQGKFVGQDEYAIATLSNGILMNVLSGEGWMREAAVVTNRRVYYNSRRGIVNLTNTEEQVDIEDVTGTKIIDRKPWGMLLSAAISLLAGYFMLQSYFFEGFGWMFIGCSVADVVLFLFRIKECLTVQYAGGSIEFTVRRYNMRNVRDFQKAIHAQKDLLKRN